MKRAGEALTTGQIVCRIGAGVWLLALVLPGLLLALVGDTARGQLCGATAIAVGVFPLLFIVARRRGPRLAAAGCAAFALVGLLGLAFSTPGGTRTGVKVRHFLQAGDAGFGRWRASNVVPEGDQLRLGFTLMSLLDPLLTKSQVATLKRETSRLYFEMGGAADFHGLGSVMSESYAELRGGSPTVRHAYVYVPERAKRGSIIFFHGSGGNFKAYLWILRVVSEASGLVLVAPSYGMGNWTPAATTAALDLALAAAREATGEVPENFHAVGISNGGLALSALLESGDARVKSIIGINPVLALTDRPKPPTPFHVLTGAADDLVPLRYLENEVRRLNVLGAKPALYVYSDADHFLFFTHEQRLVRDLTRLVGP